jgi:hypothetical protein
MLKLDELDFEQLWLNSMNWEGVGWEEQEGRFDPVGWKNKTPLNYSFKRIYWFERYADVLLAKVFLADIKQDFEVYFDNSDETYVIVTNYGGAL